MIRLAAALILIAAEASAAERGGSFEGGRTTGDVTVVQIDGQWVVRLEENFVHEGAPDPWVALGKDGFRRDAQLGPLREDTGAQIYPIPERFRQEDFNQVYIWCQEFSTSLGRAWLK
ncbi:MAG: DM13 domain-containing protein [Pseudomonadota bacterium]